MSAHHQQYEYKKFKLKDHAKSDSTSDELSKELTLKQHRLLPFTIDHHGMLGPIAKDLLIGHPNSTFDTAPNDYDKRSTSIETQNLIRLSMHKNRHRNILTKATRLWKQQFGSTWFTNTYHAQTPGQWAKQVLGNTYSIHSAKHILFALNRLNMKIDSKTPKSTKAERFKCKYSDEIIPYVRFFVCFFRDSIFLKRGGLFFCLKSIFIFFSNLVRNQFTYLF